MKKPSIREVAKLAGVSTATVSNVFSGKKPVNKDLKERVQNAAESLGYQVNRVASQLRSQHNKVVTVLVPNITDTFFATIVTLLESFAYEQGYDVIVASAHDQTDIEQSRIRTLLSWHPAGMIVVPCSGNLPQILIDKADACPVVLVDRVAVDESALDSITINNRDSGEMACRYLIEAGHEKILTIASDLSFPPINERVEGGKQAVAALLENTNSATHDVIEIGADLDAGAVKVGEWLDANSHPTAIFSLTNVTTLSTLTALAERNIKVGEDISLLVFDDYAWMSARSVSLTAVRQPVEAIAKHAWDRLMLRINRDAEQNVKLSTVLEAELIERASVLNFATKK
ncbi:LacI family DNA-binding transcriptional regulator [Vibrio penaeicida]|uniref:LacI family DNA-binding transcriptional regulator n=1 Tax=Vibrio penaeicida TaxID=104609 RepID=UPI002733F3FC|nr:LacI family DNA-binding transcriptional regulator [Vibrio penaeicida]MDP2574478.1 LacI family DNA-binding transcriptional regulator [Vibrio penaeicida]